MKKNKSGFSIMIGMGLMVLIVLSAYVILAFIIPFMKSTSGIENTSNAYYQAYTGIEQSLYHVKERTSLTTETGGVIGGPIRYIFNTYSSGTNIPQIGLGNSEYNSGYNIISFQDPIQLEIGGINGLGSKNIEFVFKVPAFTGGTIILSGSSTPIVNWLLSSDNNTLMASGSFIKENKINKSNTETITWEIKGQPGLTLFGSGIDFETFYNGNCNDIGSGCVLKMFLLDNLVSTTKTVIPYLEYKIDFDGNNVADRYTRIESIGESYGYQKRLDVRVPQQTVEQSFDFTVF